MSVKEIIASTGHLLRTPTSKTPNKTLFDSPTVSDSDSECVQVACNVSLAQDPLAQDPPEQGTQLEAELVDEEMEEDMEEDEEEEDEGEVPFIEPTAKFGPHPLSTHNPLSNVPPPAVPTSRFKPGFHCTGCENFQCTSVWREWTDIGTEWGPGQAKQKEQEEAMAEKWMKAHNLCYTRFM